MMSEVAYFVKDVVGPKGCVSIVMPQEGQKDASAESDLGFGRHRPAHQDQRAQGPLRRDRRREQFHAAGPVDQHGRRARSPGALRARAGVFPEGDPRGSGPVRLDERCGQQLAHRARRRREHPDAVGRSSCRPDPVRVRASVEPVGAGAADERADLFARARPEPAGGAAARALRRPRGRPRGHARARAGGRRPASRRRSPARSPRRGAARARG